MKSADVTSWMAVDRETAKALFSARLHVPEDTCILIDIQLKLHDHSIYRGKERRLWGLKGMTLGVDFTSLTTIIYIYY